MRHQRRYYQQANQPVNLDGMANELLSFAEVINRNGRKASGDEDWNMQKGFKVGFDESLNSVTQAWGKVVTPTDTNNAVDHISITDLTSARDNATFGTLTLGATNQAVAAGAEAALWEIKAMSAAGGTAEILHPAQLDDSREVVVRSPWQAAGVGPSEGEHIFAPYSTSGVVAVGASSWTEPALVMTRLNIAGALNQIQIRIGINALGDNALTDIKMTIRLVRYYL